MSDYLLTQVNPNPILTPPTELRRQYDEAPSIAFNFNLWRYMSGSTAASNGGAAGYRQLQEVHDRIVRELITLHHGRGCSHVVPVHTRASSSPAGRGVPAAATWGPGRKPGASSYTRQRLSLSLSRPRCGSTASRHRHSCVFPLKLAYH